MAILENENIITIKLPEELTEENINSLKAELKNYDFKEKIENFKSKNKNIIIDSSGVNDIDFFGYQHLYGFCFFIKKTLNFNNFKVENKSEFFINFEKKYGLYI